MTRILRLRKVAAWPPEDDTTLRAEIEHMANHLVSEGRDTFVNMALEDDDPLQQWHHLQRALSELSNDPFAPLARVRVLSDRVIETLTYDANVALYGPKGKAADLAQPSWCTLGNRMMFRNYAGDSSGMHRYIVLPEGPVRTEELNGQVIPVGVPVAVTVTGSGKLASVYNEYNESRALIPFDRMKAVARALDEALGTDYGAMYETSADWEKFKGNQTFWHELFDYTTASMWFNSGYAQRFLQAQPDTHPVRNEQMLAEACSRLHKAGLSPEEANNWAEVIPANYSRSITRLYACDMSPAAYKAYADVFLHRMQAQGKSAEYLAQSYLVPFLVDKGIGARELDKALDYLEQASCLSAEEFVRWLTSGREGSSEHLANLVMVAKLLAAGGMAPEEFDDHPRALEIAAVDPRRRTRFILRNGFDAFVAVTRDEPPASTDLNRRWRNYKTRTAAHPAHPAHPGHPGPNTTLWLRRVAVAAPADEETLRREIEVLRRLQGEESTDAAQTRDELVQEWRTLYKEYADEEHEDEYEDHLAIEELARVNVLSDSVIETLTYDANKLLYGEGGRAADLARPKWCTTRERDVFDDYVDPDGVQENTANGRRYIVLPGGPSRFEAINGQQVPVGENPVAITLDTEAQGEDTSLRVRVREITDHRNRGPAKMPPKLLHGVMQKLDEVLGTNLEVQYAPDPKWEDFPFAVEIWKIAFGDDEEGRRAAHIWANSPYAHRLARSWGDDRMVASACAKLHKGGMSVEHTMAWVEATGLLELDGILPLYKENITPPVYVAYRDVMQAMPDKFGPKGAIPPERVQFIAERLLGLHREGISATELRSALEYLDESRIIAGTWQSSTIIGKRYVNYTLLPAHEAFVHAVKGAKLLRAAGVPPEDFLAAARHTGKINLDSGTLFLEIMGTRVRQFIRFIKKHGINAFAELVDQHLESVRSDVNLNTLWRSHQEALAADPAEARTATRPAPPRPAHPATRRRTAEYLGREGRAQQLAKLERIYELEYVYSQAPRDHDDHARVTAELARLVDDQLHYLRDIARYWYATHMPPSSDSLIDEIKAYGCVRNRDNLMRPNQFRLILDFRTFIQVQAMTRIREDTRGLNDGGVWTTDRHEIALGLDDPSLYLLDVSWRIFRRNASSIIHKKTGTSLLDLVVESFLAKRYISFLSGYRLSARLGDEERAEIEECILADAGELPANERVGELLKVLEAEWPDELGPRIALLHRAVTTAHNNGPLATRAYGQNAVNALTRLSEAPVQPALDAVERMDSGRSWRPATPAPALTEAEQGYVHAMLSRMPTPRPEQAERLLRQVQPGPWDHEGVSARVQKMVRDILSMPRGAVRLGGLLLRSARERIERIENPKLGPHMQRFFDEHAELFERHLDLWVKGGAARETLRYNVITEFTPQEGLPRDIDLLTFDEVTDDIRAIDREAQWRMSTPEKFLTQVDITWNQALLRPDELITTRAAIEDLRANEIVLVEELESDDPDPDDDVDTWLMWRSNDPVVDDKRDGRLALRAALFALREGAEIPPEVTEALEHANLQQIRIALSKATQLGLEDALFALLHEANRLQDYDSAFDFLEHAGHLPGFISRDEVEKQYLDEKFGDHPLMDLPRIASEPPTPPAPPEPTPAPSHIGQHDAYWVNPQGEWYAVRGLPGSPNLTHDMYAARVLKYPDPPGLLEQGWVRVYGRRGVEGHPAHMKKLKTVAQHLASLLRTGGVVYIDAGTQHLLLHPDGQLQRMRAHRAGLHDDEARVTERVYHGSNEPDMSVEEFDLSVAGGNGFFGTGLYTSPDFDTAARYGKYVYEFVFSGKLFDGERIDTNDAVGGCGPMGGVSPFRFRLGQDEYHCGWYGESGLENEEEWTEFLEEHHADIEEVTYGEGTDSPDNLLWEINWVLKNRDNPEAVPTANRLRAVVEQFIRAHEPEGTRYEIDSTDIGGEVEAAGYDAVEIPGLCHSYNDIEILVFDPEKTLELVRVHDTSAPHRADG
jgi:hypothetical protein